MFPIRDHNPSRRTPYVTLALIALNVAVFLSGLALLQTDRALALFYYDYALLPVRLSNGENYAALVTSVFLHGGWMHLAGNMLFLWIFGDNLEDEMGHLPFLAFYLACGIGASLAQVAADPASQIPTVGASGAIAGVMGGLSAAVSQGAGGYSALLCGVLSHHPRTGLDHARTVVRDPAFQRDQHRHFKRRRRLLGACGRLCDRFFGNRTALAQTRRHPVLATNPRASATPRGTLQTQQRAPCQALGFADHFCKAFKDRFVRADHFAIAEDVTALFDGLQNATGLADNHDARRNIP